MWIKKVKTKCFKNSALYFFYTSHYGKKKIIIIKNWIFEPCFNLGGQKSQISYLPTWEKAIHLHSIPASILQPCEFTNTDHLFCTCGLLPPPPRNWTSGTFVSSIFCLLRVRWLCRTGWHLTQPFLMGGCRLRDKPAMLSHSYLFSSGFPWWMLHLGAHFPPDSKSLHPVLQPRLWRMVSFTAPLYHSEIRTFPRWKHWVQICPNWDSFHLRQPSFPWLLWTPGDTTILCVSAK